MIDCLIVDDEKDSVNVLKHFAKEIPSINIICATTNPVEALRLINEKKVQLAFCDIQMPLVSGLDIAKAAMGKCKLVFVTAYKDFALEGFEHEAVDFLMKPVSFSRFFKAYQKAENLISLNSPKMDLQTLNHKLKNYELSRREIEIIENVLKTQTAKEIGENLNISTSTVNTHIANIFKKMNVNNRIEIVSLIYNT